MTRQHDSRYKPPVDPYHFARCECGHLIYRYDTPGGRCLFCDCTAHIPREVGDEAD